MSKINEKTTSWDSFEMRNQKSANEKLRQQLAAKRGVQLDPEKRKAANRIKSSDNVVREDTISSIIEDLKNRFLITGKEMVGGPSVRAMQQFMRKTDGIMAKKNNAGGSIFTDNNKDKNFDELASVYENVRQIRIPVNEIAYILKNTKKYDTQHLELLRNKILDLCEVMPLAIHEIIHDKFVLGQIQKQVPFWVGGSEIAGGHNIGMRDILRQFNKDLKNQTYQQIAQRIDDYITKGKDPLSYVAESKNGKFTIKESALRKMIAESLARVINEGTSSSDSISKWNECVEVIGAEQMLQCIFKWSNSDQIDQWLEWFEEEGWVDFGVSDYEDEEY